MDPLYDEEYDPSGAHSLLTPDCDEESMDIYSGLGDTPTHTTETPSMLFSPRLKASMDLYEEILTEEVRSKDSSFEELKSRFLAAQIQIEELRSRLTATETKNTGLSTENLRLKKNISALLKTARQEVLRKDQEIQRLNQSSGMKTYNPRGNGQWRTFPYPHTNTPPPVQPPPRPGPGDAPSPIAPTSRTAAAPAATPPYPPPPQHRPCRTSSAGSSTSTTPLIPPSHALPPPQARRTSLTRSSAATCRPPAPPTETAPPSLPQPQQSKTPSSLSATCTPPPPPTNPAPPKRRPSRTSTTPSSLPCRPPAPPTESPLPAPSQSGLGKRSSRISSTSTPSAPPANPPPPPPSPPPSLPLPKPIRTSSRISTSKEPSPPPPPTLDPPPPPPPTLEPPPPPPPPPPTLEPPPPPPPTLDPPPPPPPTLDPPPPPPPTVDPPPSPVLHPPAPSPLSEDVRPESFPPPPPPEKVSDRAAQRPDTTCLEVGRSKRPAHSHPTRSSSSDLEATVKPKEVDCQSSREVPAELCELDTARPSKHKEQEPKSQTRSHPTEKRLKSGPEPGKDCETDPRNRSRRAEKESRAKHRSHRLLKSSRSQEAEAHHRSESGESPSSGGLDRRQDKPDSNQNRAVLIVSRLRDLLREPRKEKHGDRAGEKRASGSSRDRRNAAPKQHPSGDDRRKAERRREDETRTNGRRERRIEKHKDSDRNRRKDEGRRRAELRGGEKSTKDLEKASEEEISVPAGTQCLTENSPNRKLCFMETLNLTLSPVKKPLSQQGQADGEEEEEGEILSREDEDQPNLEEFLIIDEIESSMTEMEIDHDKQNPKPSSAVQTFTEEKWATENCKEDQSLRTSETGAVVVSGRPEVPPVPSPSAGVLPEAEEVTEAGVPTLKRPVTAKESIVVSKRPAENRQCPSPNDPVVMEMSETLNLGRVELVRISEDGKGSPSRNSMPGNLSEVIEPAEPTVLHSEPDLQESLSKAPVDYKKLSSPCPLPSAEEVKETVLLSPLTSPVAEKVKEGVLLSPLTSPVVGEVKETVLLSPLTSPVVGEVKETVLLSPLTSPVAEKVKETVLLSPLASPVAGEVKEAVSGSRPISSSVADVVKEAVSLPCPIPRPVCGEVNKGGGCLSPITGPVSKGVHQTTSTPRPLKEPVPGEENGRAPSPWPITRLVAGEAQGKVRPGPPNARPPEGEGEGECRGGSPKGSDAVSSTITLEALPHGDISLPEAIYALTHADDGDEPGSTSGCVGVSKVSSTTEDVALPGRRESVQERTPLKGYGFCERHGAEPSSSGPPLHDEDSMMLTLRNLRTIPDVISPLRSPMARPLGPLGPRGGTKPPHVKSLQRDFCSSGIFHSLKPNPKKETQPPGGPVAPDPGGVTSLRPPAARSEGPSPPSSDLEEGEILSDSNEAPADTTPGPQPTGPASADKDPEPSPRAARRRLSLKGVGRAPPPSTPSPSSGKSRFKTVCPAVEQAAFRSAGEVMDTLKKVRFQIRKKYMKLHKVFPKKSFYAMMDHFQQSFMEYVENAAFGEISGQVGPLKARLGKLVASVFGKVMNNGIVNRIFDQQATNLKRRLWEFVEVQLDYLFLDIEKALNAFCKPAETLPPASPERQAVHPKNGKILKKSPANVSPKKSGSSKQKRLQRRLKPSPVVPTRTGLGRGKDIRIICTERLDADAAFPPRGTPLSPERGQRGSLLLSHSAQDRSDYDILTEQQASSLTFNLVRDTQMGEIFKCLMQGSDLLDASGAGGDHTSWSLSTPRKEGPPGDGLLGLPSPGKFLSPSKFASPGKFMTPTKFVTSPSRLAGTWCGLLSPGRLCSPQPKLLRMPLHPSVFDESCLLELPSGSGAAAQRSYSLLAEDLAVSLTIPSPLKSDSHLSFLQPPRTLDMMSTPESVISAHFGEDALLDGEDAWEQQDLHLALDTDHSDSSCCSSSTSAAAAGAAGAAPASMLFQYKPHLPMQAEVMERSNDHFIIKIRQFAADAADVTLTAADEATPTAGDDSLSRTLTEEAEPSAPGGAEPVPRALFLEKSFAKSPRLLPKRQKAPPPEEAAPADPGSPQEEAEPGAEGPPSRPPDSALSADEMGLSTASEGRLAIVEDGGSGPGRGARGAAGRKRRRHHQQRKTGAKRARKEEGGQGRGRRCKPVAAAAAASPRGAKQSGGAGSPPKTPPSGLSAKNLVKKKGEVVVAWTREEDRSILLDLKTKGPSRETFSVLSEKLNKTSAQIAERFSQLMKLFKKQEKRTSP